MKATRVLFAVWLVVLAGYASAASDPKAQALSLYRAMQRTDWKALYYLAAFSPAIKKQLPPPAKFATDVQKGIDQSGNAKMVMDLFHSMKNITVGKATVMGNKATVPTSSLISVQGKSRTFHGLARMILEAGVWKWDLTFTNDPEKATSTALQELLGKPAAK